MYDLTTNSDLVAPNTPHDLLAPQLGVCYQEILPDGMQSYSDLSPLCTGVVSESFLRKIGDQCQIGLFENEHDYLLALDHLYSAINETVHLRAFFRQYLFQKLIKKDSILDVGVGNGIVSSEICPMFEAATLVDVNQAALNATERLIRTKSHRVSLSKYKGHVSSLPVDGQGFDCVLFSHVLYYMRPTKWADHIKYAYSLLNKGGVLVIALSGGMEKRRLAIEFGVDYFGVEYLFNVVFGLFLEKNIQVYDIKDNIELQDLSSALCLTAVYLNDMGAVADRKAVVDYLKKYHEIDSDKTTNFYRFTATQRVFLIRKPQD